MIEALKKKYPTLLILFVPASCTGVLQPLDVDFNMPFKTVVRKHVTAFLVNLVMRAVTAGAKPTEVPIPHKKSEFVPHFVSWIQAGIDWGNTETGRKSITRAWKKTGLLDAWNDVDNADILEEARARQEAGTLFTNFHDKEVPILPRHTDALSTDPHRHEESLEEDHEEDDVVLDDPADEEDQQTDEHKDDPDDEHTTLTDTMVEAVSSSFPRVERRQSSRKRTKSAKTCDSSPN